MRGDPSAYELSRDLLARAGYAVGPDVDQPGWYVWTRSEKGQPVAACDMSLDTADAAWEEVHFMVAEVIEDEEALDADAWNALTAEARFEVIARLFD